MELEMSEEKRTRKVKVMVLRSIFVEDESGTVSKVSKGSKVLLTSAEIKHFGSAVTKDFDDDED
jgi:hypothetical protein